MHLNPDYSYDPHTTSELDYIDSLYAIFLQDLVNRFCPITNYPEPRLAITHIKYQNYIHPANNYFLQYRIAL